MGIGVSDMKTSIQFYENQFGFHYEQGFSLADEEIVFIKNGEARIELIYAKGTSPSSASQHVCLEVKSLNEWKRHISLVPVEGPFKLNNGWETIFYQGPDGETIELLQLNENRGT
ncbi:VOC family protein [Thalassobacillus hwangdonensis]|uniref:VOC family protein n=1 Tax=Thalassobacillus hwangdonensis TaxID=546108 RepID=A0ABW3KZ73_9BACI